MRALSWVTTESQLSGRLQVESGPTGVALAAGNTHTGGLGQRKLADLQLRSEIQLSLIFSNNCLLILLSVRTYIFPILPDYIAYLHCRGSN